MELCAVCQDDFQIKFWKLRQSLWQQYTKVGPGRTMCCSTTEIFMAIDHRYHHT